MDSRTVTVFSSKGGVGKTFVTVNLATTLALAKYKVLLIDLDLQAGEIADTAVMSLKALRKFYEEQI